MAEQGPVERLLKQGFSEPNPIPFWVLRQIQETEPKAPREKQAIGTRCLGMFCVELAKNKSGTFTVTVRDRISDRVLVKTTSNDIYDGYKKYNTALDEVRKGTLTLPDQPQAPEPMPELRPSPPDISVFTLRNKLNTASCGSSLVERTRLQQFIRTLLEQSVPMEKILAANPEGCGKKQWAAEVGLVKAKFDEEAELWRRAISRARGTPEPPAEDLPMEEVEDLPLEDLQNIAGCEGPDCP